MTQIKVIYEEEAVLPIKAQIAQLDSQQLFFVEQFIKQERQRRKQQVFAQWKVTLAQLVKQG